MTAIKVKEDRHDHEPSAAPTPGGDNHRIVRELCAEARLPVPKLYVTPDRQPNAFATGRDPFASLFMTHPSTEERVRRLVSQDWVV